MDAYDYALAAFIILIAVAGIVYSEWEFYKAKNHIKEKQ